MPADRLPARAAVIGCGALGACFVRRLLERGVQVAAHDIDAGTHAGLRALGADVRASAADAARGADVVVTCVTDPAAVAAAVTGPGGVIETAAAGAVLIETTTSHPAVTRRVAQALAERGVAVIDAPVSRGIPAAATGTLSIMVGGDSAVLARARPVLEVFGTDIFHVGDIGAGHVVKAVNMAVMGANLLALIEGVALAARCGLDRAEVAAALEGGPAASFMTASHYPKYVLSGTFRSNFGLALMAKDVRVAAAIGRDLGLPLPVSSRVEDVYAAALRRGAGVEDNMRMVGFVEGLMGSGRTPAIPPSGLADALPEALAAVNAAAAIEGALVASAAGVDPLRSLQVVNASSGASRSGEALERWLGGAPAPGVAAGAWHDGLTRCLDAARAAQAPLYVLSGLAPLLAAAARDGAALPALAEVMEDLAGCRLRPAR
jgi:3-hydroxyisobutyrate dehydrogenase-like beta-hydroxyacid dehydrogenase